MSQRLEPTPPTVSPAGLMLQVSTVEPGTRMIIITGEHNLADALAKR